MVIIFTTILKKKKKSVMMNKPKPIRRHDGKILKFAGYKVPDPLAKTDAEIIAETLEQIMLNPGLGGGPYQYNDDDDYDFGIDVNQYMN